MNAIKEAALIEHVINALDKLGLNVQIQRERPSRAAAQADAWLRIGRDKQNLDYVAECKLRVTAATVGAMLVQLRQLGDVAGRTPLLVTDYLPPPLAELLRARNQQFADTAGNVYLEGPGMLVYVTGRKPLERTRATATGRAFTPAGLRVLFALICNPELADAPQRTIAATAGVALGAIPAVMTGLEQTGHLLIAGRRRRLNATRRLLDEWALMYARTLRSKTLRAVYVAPGFDAWKNWQLDPQEVRWGGEPAAHLLVRNLKPGVLTLYAHRLPPKLLVEQRLTAAGPLATEKTVEVREPFWGEALQKERQGNAVPPALIYADLLATGDGRCIETAELVYDRYLAQFFPAG